MGTPLDGKEFYLHSFLAGNGTEFCAHGDADAENILEAGPSTRPRALQAQQGPRPD